MGMWWNGRHYALKMRWLITVWVRVPPSLPKEVYLISAMRNCDSVVQWNVVGENPTSAADLSRGEQEYFLIWYCSQMVRHRSATPVIFGSSPNNTSIGVRFLFKQSRHSLINLWRKMNYLQSFPPLMHE